MNNCKCNICGKSFKNKQSLGGHKSSHFRNLYKRKIVNCVYCGKEIEIPENINKLYCSHYCHNRHKVEERLNKPAIFGKIKLEGITFRELEEIRNNSKFCQICGKSIEDIKNENNHFNHLCVDHDHNTNKFRGMLCVTCNRNLGWYEHYQNQIINYLQKSK